MRYVSFLLLLFFALACATPGKRSKSRGRLSPKEVRKRFVLCLYDHAPIKWTYHSVKKMHFQGKHAQCNVVKVFRKLHMLVVRCRSVRSPGAALLMNARLKKLPGVKTSTPDAVITTSTSETDRGTDEGPMTPMFKSVRVVGDGVPYNWGLDRIDEDSSPLDGEGVDYSCYPRKGGGVNVFVIDTGCMTEHDEFSDIKISTMPTPGSDFANGNDDHGHGTHIAGVVAGKNVGLAKNAEVTCIKAFDRHGNGAASDTLSAVEYILEQKFRNASVPYIINLSYSALTGFMQTPLDEMVYAASAKGIVFVVSAGNAAVNSCLFSPSKAKQAFTVTASTTADKLEEDSNIGPCVEFIAPGHNIVSAGIDSPRDYESLNGTSMATPHVVGLSALVLAEYPELQANPRTVRDVLYQVLLLTRTADVDDFMMPLMQTGCATGETAFPNFRKRSFDSSVANPTPLPLASLPPPSPLSSVSFSTRPFPSVSPSPSLIPSESSEPTQNDQNAEEKRKEFGNIQVSAANNYYMYGFGPHTNPYENSQEV